MDKVLNLSPIESQCQKLLIDLTLSYPVGMKITKEVVDFSEAGLSFKMEIEEGFFPVGTPLYNITVRSGQKSFKTLGQVIYVKKVKENKMEFYRIGIKFDNQTNGSLGQKKLSFFPLRPRRYSAKDILAPVKFVSFKGEQGEEFIGDIVDFSKFGAAFNLEKKSPILRVSQILRDFKVVIQNEIAFSGNASINNLRKHEGKLIIGVCFESESIDIDKLFYLGTKSLLPQEVNKDISSFKISDRIDSHFKSEVADLRYYLENLKHIFEKFESQIQNETVEKKKVLEIEIIESAEKEAFPTINSSIAVIGDLVKNFDKHLDDIHKDYFRHHLHNLFLTSPFINRSFRKPLGYAGDYEMMNMLYRSPYEGHTLLGQFLNKHIWQTPAGQAVRNRAPYLVDKMKLVIHNNEAKKRTNNTLITSVGCGPAREIQDFLLANEESNKCEFYPVDSDKNALLYCQEKVLDIKLIKKRKTEINILHKSVTEIARQKNYPFLKKQDLIYSIGLFDYLTTDLSRHLINIFYENLNPNGTLIIGNFDPSNKTRNYLEYVMEWYLIHRSENEMLNLADGLENPLECFVEREAANINNFLIIRKG